MNKKEQILAKKIISRLIGNEYMPAEMVLSLNEVYKLMEDYHEAKMKEITDADIEEWAFRNYPDSYNMRKSCKAGAKAMREGEIKHIDA